MKIKAFFISVLFVILYNVSSYSKTVEVDLIADSLTLDLRKTPLGVLSGSGIFAAIGNRIVSASSDMTMRCVNVDIPENTAIDDFVFVGDKLLMKIDDSIVWTSPSSGFEAYTLPDQKFRLCSASDSTAYILTDNRVFEFNLKKKILETSVNVAEPPIAAYPLRDGLLLITSRSVLSMYNNEWTQLHRHPGEIRAGAIMPSGIFVGTDEGLWKIAGNNIVELIATGGVMRMYSDAHKLYVLDAAGNLISFNFD